MRRFLAILATSALFLAGCAGDSGPDAEASPKEALVSAFRGLADMPGITVTIRLDAAPEDLVSLAGDGGDELTIEDAQKIVDSSLVISARNESDPENQQTELVANIAGIDNAVELKVVGDTIYARASVEDLVGVFGGDLSEIQAGLAGAPPGFEFIGAALQGQWIGISGLQQLAEQFGGAAATQSEEQEQQALQFADDMAAAFEANAEVTFEGDEDPGAHLVATVNIRDIYDDFLQAFGALGTLVTGQMGQLPDAASIPDEELTLDFWVADDRVTQVGFDFIQLAAIAGEDAPSIDSFGVLVELDEFDGDVEAPDDFVEVDLAALLQGFMGGLGGTGSTETVTPESELPADFCESLAEAPEEVQAQFEAECPELAG